MTTTAGDVLFTGELTGDFLALDAKSGDVLYRFNTGGPLGGGVVTYAASGRQYVAAASGSPSNFWIETPRLDLDAGSGKGAGAPTVVVFTWRDDRASMERETLHRQRYFSGCSSA